MNKRILFLVVPVMFGTASAYAADTGFYAGASLGQSKLSDFDASDLDAELASVGITSSSSVDDTDTGWKLFAGYRFMKYFAVEGAYVNFGEATAHSIITAPSAGTVDTTAEADAWTLSALGILPLNEKFSLFARVGLNIWDAEVSATGTGGGGSASFSDDADGTDWVYGVGAAYDITQNLSVRGEWERYDLDDTDLDLLSVGVSWRF